MSKILKGGRLPKSEFTSRPWRMHAIAPDFEIEDVWALPTPGGPDDFSLLVADFTGGDWLENSQSAIGKQLIALRWKLGKWFGWDDEQRNVAAHAASLRYRLPGDLGRKPMPPVKNKPFTSLYLLDNEYAAEIINGTVHGIVHAGWVEDGAGGYYCQMAVLVKPKGLLGKLYMALIKPFRYLIVYPAFQRSFRRKWPKLLKEADTKNLKNEECE